MFIKKPVLIVLVLVLFIEGSSIHLETEEIYKIGGKDFVFGKIKSLAQDNQGNLYVPDSRLYKIYKFSPTGKLILSFGQKGKGPGDFTRLDHIMISSHNQLMVADGPVISIFDLSGRLLKQQNIWQNGALGTVSPKFASEKFLWARKFTSRDTPPPLVLIQLEQKVKIIDKRVFSASPVTLFREAGIFNKNVTPEIWYASNSRVAVAALSDSYVIKVYNDLGIQTATIMRDIQRPGLSDKERDYLIETEINQWTGISEFMKNGLKGTLPKHKNSITGITLSDLYIFVERAKKDISDQNSPVPIDLFSLQGKYCGRIQLPSLPLLATANHFYYLEETADGEISIKKHKVRITL